MFKKALGAILAAANSNPENKEWLYGIKDRILKRFGTLVAWDQQHIIKECWSCKDGVFSGYDNGFSWVPMPKQMCLKCYGTGVFDQFWVLLEVWHLGGYEFHRPVERVRKLEYFSFKNSTPTFPGEIRNYIEGYIKHDPHPRAMLVLVWMFTPGRTVKTLIRTRVNRVRWRWRRIKARFRKFDDSEIPF